MQPHGETMAMRSSGQGLEGVGAARSASVRLHAGVAEPLSPASTLPTDTPRSLPDRFVFSRFLVCLSRREILVDGAPVHLGGRNYDLLIALITAAGNLVTKDELLSQVWPRRIVEESNLQAGISRLRKLLGQDRHLIRTVSGRGYRFTGVVQVPAKQSVQASSNLPLQSTAIIGRAAALQQLGQLVASEHLLTLCGTGGIGKTRLALEVAHRTVDKFADGVWLIDLAALSDAARIPSAIAQALGVRTDESSDSFLSDSH